MTLEGTVQNGAIVLDKGATLPEGTRVTVNVEPTEQDCLALRELLLSYAGSVKGLLVFAD